MVASDTLNDLFGGRRGASRELAWFIALTFTVSWAVAYITVRRGGLGAFPGLPLAMLVPMCVAAIVQRFVAKAPLRTGLGLRVGRGWMWLAAPLALLCLWLGTFGLTALLNPTAIQSWRSVRDSVARLQNVPPVAVGVAGKLTIAYLLTIVVGRMLNLPIFLGEEIGWRAFMTPRLVALLGRRGLLVAGIIWALWHAPFIAMGLNYPHYPVAGQFVWIPFCVAFSVFLQTVYVRARSVFPSALCHGVTNQFWALTMSVFIVEPRFRDLIDGPAGLIALAVIAAPAIVCYRRFPAFGVAEKPEGGHAARSADQESARKSQSTSAAQAAG